MSRFKTTLRASFPAAVLIALATTQVHADADAWIEFPGGAGPGAGKHVVFLTGDEEYRSEEGLPMLAQILSQKHGFRATVLFAVNPETGEIDPNNASSLPGAATLEDADAIVMLTRFRAWPEEAMAKFVKRVEAGVPIIALRTSTHAFQFPEGSEFRAYNDFGKHVLGEQWVNHWGRHKVEATRGVVEPGAEDNPILRGVVDVFGDSDVYEAYPPADATILLRGQVLAGMQADSPPADYRKARATDKVEQPINDPMMPIAWTRLHRQASGAVNRVFCTTMGAATDLRNEGLRRLIVNAVYWGLEMDVPERADVELIGKYEPTAYGFDGFQRGRTVADVAAALGVGDAKPQTDSTSWQVTPHERIALVGNSLAERMNLFGHFESLLHSRFPKHELVVRNFARPADEVGLRQRPSSYTTIDDPVKVFGAQTYLCFFGFNEAFAGAEGEAGFRVTYESYLDEMTSTYPSTDGKAPRFVIVSPIAWEPTGNPLWPDAIVRNESLRRYAEICREIAEKRGLPFVDLFTPTEQLFVAEAGMQYTINGCHLNEQGDREIALLLDAALFGGEPPAPVDSRQFAALRSAVVEKAWMHAQDHRMLNGWYVYGGRRTWDTETFPREYVKLRAMIAVRDRYVWELAQGKTPAPPDDSQTGELFVPPTRFGNPEQNYSEPEELRYLTPEESIAAMTVPAGYEVKLFASEREFPELAKPCQLNFDNRGRLWAGCMPTYPQWRPGDPLPNDRLLIFEDENGDGRADRCKVFYDKLQCPTGFEFWNGGVLVVDQPRLLWLKDTDGDDKADVVVHLLDGWASDDTHHAVGAFEFSHGGLLHMLEGIAMSTTVETPWGPHRTHGPSGAHVLDPRTLKIRHFQTPGYGNPWCYVFDSWGQGIVGDGTGAQQHWDSPLSGANVAGRRGFDPVFNNQGMRPCVGSEFLLSRHLPDDVQGQFIYACVINMNGIPRFTVEDDRSGFSGHRVMLAATGGDADRKPRPDDLLKSSDKAFRPVDPQLGPDGALWFGDWCNALIGHMQYSQRDPNRDHSRGRIFRLVAKDRPLLTPVTQYGKSEAELLEQLREYEPRTRYRARRELAGRPTDQVVAAVKAWVDALDPADPQFERLQCEALWVLASHHALATDLLDRVLQSKDYHARSAAMHIVADQRDEIPNAPELLAAGVRDAEGRVRLEALRGLSFFPTLTAAQATLAAFDAPLDPWLDYMLQHTLGAQQSAWLDAYQSGSLTADRPAAKQYIADYIARQEPGLKAQVHVKALLNPDTAEDERPGHYEAIAAVGGDRRNGAHVFQRVCATCHRVGQVGYDFGPELSDVGKRLPRQKIIESIIEPSKTVDPKYVTTTLFLSDGKAAAGFVVRTTDDEIELLMAEGKRQVFRMDEIDEVFETNQSSMPENLPVALAPGEFLDVIEYLSSLK
jgi:putative membrane-bound dehydrogenase-like protein